MWIVTYPLFLYYRFGDDGRGRPHVSLYRECNHDQRQKSFAFLMSSPQLYQIFSFDVYCLPPYSLPCLSLLTGGNIFHLCSDKEVLPP